MKLDSKAGCCRSSPAIRSSECLHKKFVETEKPGFDTKIGGTGRDGPTTISKAKILETIADQVTSKEYIGDNEPGDGLTHGHTNKRDTIFISHDKNDSFCNCKTKLCDMELDIYTEKSITEISSKLIACYKDGPYYVIKDICVDDGKQSEEKCLADHHEPNEKSSICVMQLDLDADDDLCEKLVGAVTALAKCAIDSKSSGEKDQVLNCMPSKGTTIIGDVEELMCDETPTKELIAGHSNDSTIAAQQEDANQVESQVVTSTVYFGNEKDSRSKEEESQSNESANELFLPFSSKIGNKSITFDFEPSVPPPSLINNGVGEEDIDGKLKHNHVHTSVELHLEERRLTDEPTSSMGSLYHIQEELIGPLRSNSSLDLADLSEHLQQEVHSTSASLTFSGPIPYSGSISLRSDSSTTSTRSFAFPILHSEWNSSPVRMAKADRRQFRKHRGWRMAFLCCRF